MLLKNKMYIDKPGLICALVSFLVYSNTFQAGFVYDDNRAIIRNPDVTQFTPLTSLLIQDYWGSPLNYTGSHGSYRPLTVLSFRLNHYFFGLQPWAYHVTNVLFHCLSSYLFCVVLNVLLQMKTKKIFAAGLLFAVHPIHTEAVAGVVGRADMLATLFCWLTLLTYKMSLENNLSPNPALGHTSKREDYKAVDKVHTISHDKHPKSSKKKLRKTPFKKKKPKHNKEQKLEEILTANFEDVLRYKQMLLHEKKVQDPGTLSDHSNTTTDTLDSHTSSSSSGSGSFTNDLISLHANAKDLNLRQRFAFSKGSEVERSISKTEVSKSDLQSSSDKSGSNFKANRHCWLWLVTCLLCSVCAVLSKESGYCALPLCIVYDLCFEQKIFNNTRSTLNLIKQTLTRKRTLIIFAFWVALMAFRISLPLCLSQSRTAFPKFSPSDNPAAASEDFLTRVLTFNYLLACNIQMLFFPVSLSFDWSMDAIPLITSVFDSRNIATVIMYAAGTGLLWYFLRFIFFKKIYPTKDEQLSDNFDCSNGQRFENLSSYRRLSSTSSEESLHEDLDFNTNNSYKNRLDKMKTWKSKRGLSEITLSQLESDNCATLHTVLFCSAVIAFSLLPATNLFFYVGFVLAERVLYLPSVGSCILIVEFASALKKKFGQRKFCLAETLFRCCDSGRYSKFRYKKMLQFLISYGWLLALLCYFSLKTVSRNLDWKDETSLYRSGLNTNSAKAFANLGNSFRAQNKIVEAELAYKQALEHRPNMADTHYNLGLLYQETGWHKMAEECYRLAIQYRPGMAVAHLNLGVVMAEQNQKEAAKLIYRHAASLENVETKDPVTHSNAQISAIFNLGCLLADEADFEAAIDVFLEATNKPLLNYKPHGLYNMLGQCYLHLHQLDEAERWFNASITSKPDHIPTHLTIASLMAQKRLHDGAVYWYFKALQIEPKNKEIYKHYGNFLLDTGQYQAAASLLKQATDSSFGNNDYDLIFSAAFAYRQANNYQMAEKYYNKAVKLKPNLASAHLNLGAIYHLQNKHELAMTSYKRALKLQPNNKMILENIAKLQRSPSDGR